MTTEKDWIVWLLSGAGEILLGLSSPANDHVSRFCVLGEMKGDAPAGVGIWIEVDEIQERTIPDNSLVKAFTVSPKTCLIPWGLVAYVQRGRHSEKIGFVQVQSKSK